MLRCWTDVTRCGWHLPVTTGIESEFVMLKYYKYLRHSLVSKLIVTAGLTLLLTITAWAYYNINSQKKELMANILSGTDRLTNTIRLGTHYAMMLNSRDDINQIIYNISKQPEIVNIRLYNKEGQIKFSNQSEEIDQITNIKDEACFICHRTEPPLTEVRLEERTRIFHARADHRLLGIISPIVNEPGCATGDCHFHPEEKRILGALDVVVSLENTDHQILRAQPGVIGLALLAFLVTSAIIFIFVLHFVNRPIKKRIEGTRQIAGGNYAVEVEVEQEDEMGQLAHAINRMGKEIDQRRAEVHKQRDEYQNLFERVPCLITVQDRNYRLLRYNREFAEMFDPQPGEFCYQAYKGRDEKCDICPVEKTFTDGKMHYSEESGINKDGSVKHWIVRSTPIKDAADNIVAAMEINLDITERKNLETELEKSEKNYHAIFNNIPNPVFVLDRESLDIIDCNNSVSAVYGYTKDQIRNRCFLELFIESERIQQAPRIKSDSVINQVKHVRKDGNILFVDIWISPSEYGGETVLLVITSDITQRLEAEQQLIQASKMATLGEMATGVAHELNQPLSVIKTVSSFFVKKIEHDEELVRDTLHKMLMKVDGNVDRATKIINHMRQFARKSDMDLDKLQVNEVLERSFEIFSQQLKVRGIEVVWDVQDDLPKIKADPGRLEQVFINLLINARDAIEDRWSRMGREDADDRIEIMTRLQQDQVVVKVIDTGIGIPEKILGKLFEPFFTTKEVGKGTGLGLSISYGIVKDCGGEIEATSTEGKGACFTLYFPVWRNHETESE